MLAECRYHLQISDLDQRVHIMGNLDAGSYLIHEANELKMEEANDLSGVRYSEDGQSLVVYWLFVVYIHHT